MKNNFLLGLALLGLNLTLYSQINSLEGNIQFPDLQELNSHNLLSLNEDGTIGFRSIESLAIPKLTLDNNKLYIEVNEETLELRLNTSKEQKIKVEKFQLNGSVLELKFSSGESFNVDLTALHVNGRVLLQLQQE